MKNYKIYNILFLVVLYACNCFSLDVHAQSVTSDINLGVTVNNVIMNVPRTPVIIRSYNIAKKQYTVDIDLDDRDKNVAVTLFFVVKRRDTGIEKTYTFKRISNHDADVNGIVFVDQLPGTVYDVKVRYARDDVSVYSADSNIHTITTMIDPPVITDAQYSEKTKAKLTVSVDPDFVGDTMDFVIQVKDSKKNNTFTKKVTRHVTDKDQNIFFIDNCNNDHYKFWIKYARAHTDVFSEYSQSAVISRSNDDDDDAIKTPVITSAHDITTHSMVLEIDIDKKLKNKEIDAVLYVENGVTGTVVKLQLPYTVRADGTISFFVDKLDPNTKYIFTTKYFVKKDKKWSAISDKFVAYTKDITVPPVEFVTICYEDVKTIEIDKRQLEEYFKKGAYLGLCKTKPPIKADDKIVDPSIEIVVDPPIKETPWLPLTGIFAGIVLLFSSSMMPFFSAMPNAVQNSIFLKGIEWFGVLGRRKEEKNWGTVFDQDTHYPVPAAKIILFDALGKELQVTYSDREGRFGFLVDVGEKYQIKVYKKNHSFVPLNKEDSVYGIMYDGGVIEMTDKHVMIPNIAMQSNVIDWQKYAERKSRQYHSWFSVFTKYFFLLVYICGFIFTTVMVYFYPNIINILLISLYILLFIYTTFIKRKKYGVVKNKNGKPLPFTIISLYDRTTNEKQKVAVTDSIGRYYLLAHNGRYNLKVRSQSFGDSVVNEVQKNITVRKGIVRKNITL